MKHMDLLVSGLNKFSPALNKRTGNGMFFLFQIFKQSKFCSKIYSYFVKEY